eukprot:8103-Heterococcus_DN1.PRE.1
MSTAALSGVIQVAPLALMMPLSAPLAVPATISGVVSASPSAGSWLVATNPKIDANTGVQQGLATSAEEAPSTKALPERGSPLKLSTLVSRLGAFTLTSSSRFSPAAIASVADSRGSASPDVLPPRLALPKSLPA